MSLLRSVPILALLSSATSALAQTTLYVNGSCGNDAWTGTSIACSAPDGPKRTIHAGIDASASGDTVIVAAGIYTGAGNKNLDFGGRAITLRSESGHADTIIDCENDGRGVYFHNNETADAVLEGFTIRNGNAVDANGGAILCESASPTILNCVMADNLSRNHNFGGGGGMYGHGGSPTISNCTFSGNRARLLGGGLMLRGGSPTVTDCTIAGNWLFGTGFLLGGGMFIYESNATVTHSTFSANDAPNNRFHEGYGGGMSIYGSDPTVTNCTFSGNSAGHAGGGMYNSASNSTVTDCKFANNTAGAIGGGMYNVGDSRPIVTNCTFTSNAGGRFGGGGMYNHWSSPILTNCTFSRNSAGSGGAMHNRMTGSKPVLINCVLWNGSPDEIADVNGAAATVRFSNVQGGWPGGGNIDANPLFIDPANGNYRLAAGSPCIDAGDNTAVPTGISTDLDGNPRFVDDPNTPDTGNGPPPIVDMGAHEFQDDPCDPCDTNCDGSVNAFDIEPFLDLLFGPANPCALCTGDTNGDGAVDAFDIEPFLDCLFP